ncbi:MAG: hypothetical protein LUD74_04895 [Tannerellaceae bacterium]|nr:hypothetical protein [Tannerellaceae bacterium]
MSFWFFISFIIVLRLAELVVSQRNEQWLLDQGAVEYGQGHYRFMVTLHICFFLSMIVEYFLRGQPTGSMLLFELYLLLLAVKVWVIHSLGKFWNTRIYRIPNAPLVKKGPYKYIKHPNYLVVVLEILLIPLVFRLYCTAIVFSVLNLMMLYVRIKTEDKALREEPEEAT